MLACGVVASAAFAPVSLVPRASAARASVQMETVSDLKGLATSLNPVVGFWDPLKLAEAEFWDNTNEETIGFLRHAEIKHGRVAMAAFVGYVLQSNGVHFPWAPYPGFDAAASAAMSPPEQWDALPYAGKLQILLTIGFLEWWSEIRVDGTPHYMKGGKPGYFPDFDTKPDLLPHWIGFNLYDPFKWSKGMSEETKATRLLAELNNGRLAQIGIIAFLSEQKVPGSVPFLKGVVAPYSGEVMGPLFGAGAPSIFS
mmetsp:Transcript_7988/g.19724  ORF Transcript_7988/g.19724 Transcript_7988/m.19724 type:complete len:255 (+) Transcript_7988:43-807(+)